MTIQIELTNLGKYNEGELVYSSLSLPASDEEIAEAFKSIGVATGTRYEEFFISDYDAPESIYIHKHDSIEMVNELAELLESIPGIETILSDTFTPQDVLSFADELESLHIIGDKYYYTENIIDDERLDEMVKDEAENHGWRSVKNLLEDVTDRNATHFYLAGDGNVEDLTFEQLQDVVNDLIRAVKDYI